MRALDPVDVALDLLAECPADPAEVQDQDLDRLEAATEVVARQRLETYNSIVALARRLVPDNDEDLRAALDEHDELAARMVRHDRAVELLHQYLAHTPRAADLGLGDEPSSPRSPEDQT